MKLTWIADRHGEMAITEQRAVAGRWNPRPGGKAVPIVVLGGHFWTGQECYPVQARSRVENALREIKA